VTGEITQRTHLSPHFIVQEFACHDGTPVPDGTFEMLSELCVKYLEPVRAKWGVTLVLSGYRHRQYNRQVGGAPGSFHVYRASRRGVAADIRAWAGGPTDWARTLERLHAPGLGVYADHVHVDTRPGHARW
jgi:uncharacterized protein YcbK (DUF882 family)